MEVSPLPPAQPGLSSSVPDLTIPSLLLSIVSTGLRTDFRRPNELRHFALSIPTAASTSGADGVATCSHGLTVVTSSVHGPKEARNRGGTLFDRAVINVDVSVGSWAGNERRKRGRNDKSVPCSSPTRISRSKPV